MPYQWSQSIEIYSIPCVVRTKSRLGHLSTSIWKRRRQQSWDASHKSSGGCFHMSYSYFALFNRLRHVFNRSWNCWTAGDEWYENRDFKWIYFNEMYGSSIYQLINRAEVKRNFGEGLTSLFLFSWRAPFRLVAITLCWLIIWVEHCTNARYKSRHHFS